MKHKIINDRECAWCGAHVPEAGGTGWPMLRYAVTHIDTCSDQVMRLLRTYDRSPRGRLRPRREVMALIDSHRNATVLCHQCRVVIPTDTDELKESAKTMGSEFVWFCSEACCIQHHQQSGECTGSLAE